MKRALAISAVFILTMAYIGCYTLLLNTSSAYVFDMKKELEECEPVSTISGEKETALLDFIEKRMMSKEGQIYTNIRLRDKSEETLSESIGLLMNYCVLRHRKDLFDKELDFLNSELITDRKKIRWKASKDDVSCNAAIDDLRILRALLDAYDTWADRKYFNLAGFIQDSIYKDQVENGALYEFYDWKSKLCKKNIPLCYLDLYTLDRVSEFNKGWLQVIDSGAKIIIAGRISEGKPFYYKYYNYGKKSFQFDEEYSKNKGICLTYTLYTVLHLAEINIGTEPFINWLKSEVENGKLYAWYNPESMEPVNDMESTAVYALAAVYAKKIGDIRLYHRLIDLMLAFRITDENSPNYGGFGNEQTGEFHSFDNLTALWALTLE